MTFDIPEDVADQFDAAVAVSEQSEVVTSILRRAYRPRLTEEQWEKACEAANNDPETQQIRREMDALPDTMTEEWIDSVELSRTR
jgi:hypothetical protein